MTTVAKVGGSLYGQAGLADTLRAWAGVQPGSVLLVPGGGAFADAVRELDRVHGLGDTAAHWLAVRAMSLAGEFLCHLLGVKVVSEPTGAKLEVLDAFAFFSRHDLTPHSWNVTSDSLALAAAIHLNAKRCVLLKSVDFGGATWEEVAARGWVDAAFPKMAKGWRGQVGVVNLFGEQGR